MTYKRNPKQQGSTLFDCVVQTGKCPMRCNQCYFNRGYYRRTPFVDSDQGGIVRMNCGHDSNIEKEKVLAAAATYKNVFFNTSIPNFDFPGPVVFTANREEEKWAFKPTMPHLENLMFVRLRVSSTNLDHIATAIKDWSFVPIVLTFMSYYQGGPPDPDNYEYRVRHINSYHCPKQSFIDSVMERFSVLKCGTLCRDCQNCERLYWEFVNADR